MSTQSRAVLIPVAVFLAVLCGSCSRSASFVGTWKSDAGSTWIQLAEDGAASVRLPLAIPSAEKPPRAVLNGSVIDVGFWVHPFSTQTHYRCTLQAGAARSAVAVAFDQKDVPEDKIVWMKLPVHSDKSGAISVFQAVDGKPVTGYSVPNPHPVQASADVFGKTVRLEAISFAPAFVDPSVVWRGVLEIKGRYTTEHDSIEIHVPLATTRQDAKIIVGSGTLQGSAVRFDASVSELLTGSFVRAPKGATPSVDMSGPNLIDPKGIEGAEMGQGMAVNTGTSLVRRIQNIRIRCRGREVLGTILVTEPPPGLLPPVTFECTK